MKSLSAQAQAAIDSPHVAPIRLLTIAFESGLTLRLCDRVWGAPGMECTFDGELYEPLVVSWGEIERGAIDPVSYTVDPGAAEVVVDNTVPVGGAERFTALFATHDPHYATAAIVEIYGGATAAGDLVPRFAGRIEDALDMATDRVTLVLAGSELDIANRFAHEIVTTAAFSSADPDDIGKMLGQGYGRLKRVPFRAVDAGNRTTLAVSIGPAAASINLTDTSGFETSGTIQIGLEQITYTGITANTLTGCLRGRNGTDADSHDAGAALSEIQSEYVYAWGHPIQWIEAVYVDRVRQSGNYTTYTGLAGDEHPAYPGRAVIGFDVLPVLKRQINIEDQISVDKGMHQHGSLTYTTLFSEAIRSNSGIEYPERIPGNNFDTQAFVGNGDSGTFNFLGYKNPGGTPVRWRVGLVWRRPVGSSAARLYANFRASDGTTIGVTSQAIDDYEFHNRVSSWESCSGVTWAEISAGYFTVQDYDITGNPINCCCVWIDVEHTVDASEATGVEKLGTVVLTGNSGADVVIGSEVAADIRGWQDDDLGTYTGTPFGLIERPEHICKHILINRCGLTAAAIGASYASAGAFYAANGYRLGVALLERPNVRELLNAIAAQARSMEFWEAGVHQLVPVEHEVTPAKALSAARIDQGRALLRYTPRVDIVNRMAARYAREWSGHDNETESDRAIVSAENVPSIAKFGVLETDPLSFPYIIDGAQAQDVLAWHLKERAFPRLVVDLACGYYASDLERGDIVAFDFEAGEALDRVLLGLIREGTDHFRIMDMVDRPDAAIAIQAVFAVSQFDLAASMAANGETGTAMLVLDFDVTASMEAATAITPIELIRLNELLAAMMVVSQTSAIDVLNVGATFDLITVMTGVVATSDASLSMIFELSISMAGDTATSDVVLRNIYETSSLMTAITATSTVDLFNPQDIAILATMTGATQTSAIELSDIPPEFIFEVVTTTTNETFTLPLISVGNYAFDVDWGDGSGIDTIMAYDQAETTHTYASAGTHLITIVGTIEGWSFNNSASAPKVYDVQAWGCLKPGVLGAYNLSAFNFYGCENMTCSATDQLDISTQEDMRLMFQDCHVLQMDVSGWDVAHVTDMRNMFFRAYQFDPDVSGWDISNVVSFYLAFLNCALSTAHYDAALIAWSQLSVQSGVSLTASAQYTSAAAAARSDLINNHGWSISDGGQV